MQYAGWNLLEDGSIRIEEATEDALGTYTCVPYNALGTMGQSPPARLVLKVTLLPKSRGFAGSSVLGLVWGTAEARGVRRVCAVVGDVLPTSTGKPPGHPVWCSWKYPARAAARVLTLDWDSLRKHLPGMSPLPTKHLALPARAWVQEDFSKWMI